MRRRFVKIVLGFALLVVVAVASAYGWLQWAPRRVPAGQPPLGIVESDSFAAVRDAFNAAHAEVRVLALLSPT